MVKVNGSDFFERYSLRPRLSRKTSVINVLFKIGTLGPNLKLRWLRKSSKLVLMREAFQALTRLSLVNA